MKLHPICSGCLIDQVYKAYRLLSPDSDVDEIIETQRKVMQLILNNRNNTAPYYGKIVYESIANALNCDDPYAAIKKEYNNIALSYESECIRIIESAENPLYAALLFSVMGNSIDFGTHHTIDLKSEINNLKNNGLDDAVVQELLAKIKTSSQILIVGDNCGEIVFDKILISQLKKTYPNKHYYYSVRGGPILNDATIEDAKYVGLDTICNIVKTSQAPGVIFEESSIMFKRIMKDADLIISKGQGNFESLVDFKLLNPTQSLYFLLKVKCKLMEMIFKKKQGEYILIDQKNVKLPF